VQRIDPSPDTLGSVIPNFCRARAIYPLIFVMQMVATVLTLANIDYDGNIINRYILISLYLQWLGLSCAAVLCWMRLALMRLPPRWLFFACWGLLLLVTFVVSQIAWTVAHRAGLPLIEGAQMEFVYSNLCISGIIAPLVLRYFWVQNQWRTQMRAEGEARYQALHARIRPHFLFNSLNSVAALIATQPAVAERMIEDLSDLFRVSLSAHQRLAPLGAEVEIVQKYLRIEQVRLGEKLQVEWQVPEQLLEVPIPPLSLQPLVENAVLHGVSRLRDGGLIRIVARSERDSLIIDVENPIAPPDDSASDGAHIAVQNIAQRLALIYGAQAALSLGPVGERYQARLRLPLRPPVTVIAEDA
jgi:two-component system sensor histidine kinase AlgZ